MAVVSYDGILRSERCARWYGSERMQTCAVLNAHVTQQRDGGQRRVGGKSRRRRERIQLQRGHPTELTVLCSPHTQACNGWLLHSTQSDR